MRAVGTPSVELRSHVATDWRRRAALLLLFLGGLTLIIACFCPGVALGWEPNQSPMPHPVGVLLLLIFWDDKQLRIFLVPLIGMLVAAPFISFRLFAGRFGVLLWRLASTILLAPWIVLWENDGSLLWGSYLFAVACTIVWAAVQIPRVLAAEPRGRFPIIAMPASKNGSGS